MLRYLHFENRQSVAFSSGIKYLNYRYNQKWLLQNKSAFLLGFNKWDDVDEESRTLEELFLFQYTMTQKATFNTLDKGFQPESGNISGQPDSRRDRGRKSDHKLRWIF